MQKKKKITHLQTLLGQYKNIGNSMEEDRHAQNLSQPPKVMHIIYRISKMPCSVQVKTPLQSVTQWQSSDSDYAPIT